MIQKSLQKSYLLLGVAILLNACTEASFQTVGGYEYKIIASNSGKKPVEGDYVYYHVTSYVKQQLINTSRKNDFPQVYQIQTDSQLIKMESPFIEVLHKMTEGDSAVVIQSLEKVRRVPDEYKDAREIIYGVRLVRILNQKEYDEDKLMQRKTISDSKQAYRNRESKARTALQDLLNIHQEVRFMNFNVTASGLKYKILYDPKTNKKATLNEHMIDLSYYGLIANGEKLGSSYQLGMPYRYVVGTDNVMPGWNELATLFSIGTEAIVYLPADLAYGSRNFKGDVEIPPNSDLIFHIIIENILPIKPNQ